MLFGRKKSYEELEAEKKNLKNKIEYNKKLEEIKQLRKKSMNPNRKKAQEIVSKTTTKLGKEVREYRKRNKNRWKKM